MLLRAICCLKNREIYDLEYIFKKQSPHHGVWENRLGPQSHTAESAPPATRSLCSRVREHGGVVA